MFDVASKISLWVGIGMTLATVAVGLLNLKAATKKWVAGICALLALLSFGIAAHSVAGRWQWPVVFRSPIQFSTPTPTLGSRHIGVERTASEKWLSPEQSIELFVPVADQKDLSEAGINLRDQLLNGQLIAQGYDKEKGAFVNIPTQDWRFLNLVIREPNAGGHVPGLSAEAGGAGRSFFSIEIRRNCDVGG